VRLVETLRSQGIRDLAVLKAFAEVPRHRFVPAALQGRSYEDAALPIGSGQTISRPFTQARSLELLELEGEERVLEVGTGSGYQAALLGRLAGQVFTVERLPALAAAAQRALRATDAANVSVLAGDGTLGWSSLAPFDAIVVAAGGPVVPEPLLEQLAEGGRLLMPLGKEGDQRLILARRAAGTVKQLALDPASFVPLVGLHGWPE
jgi:protein-L-isoaspartate(D-aspartate) O-methyltransferase